MRKKRLNKNQINSSRKAATTKITKFARATATAAGAVSYLKKKVLFIFAFLKFEKNDQTEPEKMHKYNKTF